MSKKFLRWMLLPACRKESINQFPLLKFFEKEQLVIVSDVARTRPPIFQDQDRSGQCFFKTKTVFLKTIKLLTQDLKIRSLTEKTGQLCRF